MSVIVSFATPEYEPDLALLARSLLKFDITGELERAPCRGSWLANCGMKSEFLLRKLEEHPGEPIVWLDADARVKSDPELFDTLGPEEWDLGAHFLGPRTRLQSGTLWLGNTPKCRELVEAWVDRCRRFPEVNDQQNLEAVVKAHTSDLPPEADRARVFVLPESYCVISGITKKKADAPPTVILHTQASRRLRNVPRGK